MSRCIVVKESRLGLPEGDDLDCTSGYVFGYRVLLSNELTSSRENNIHRKRSFRLPSGT